MDERVHIVYLNSAETSKTYSEDRAVDFTIRLPQSLQLEPVGDWYCCLRQCSFGFAFPAPLYVCCDAVTESSAGTRRLPVLRVVHRRREVIYSNCMYVPVKVRDIPALRVYLLRTTDYAPPTFEKETAPTHFTLEFRRGLREAI
jgi:hypothetical protein